MYMLSLVEKGQQSIPGVFPLCRLVFEQTLLVAAAELGVRVLGVRPAEGKFRPSNGWIKTKHVKLDQRQTRLSVM